MLPHLDLTTGPSAAAAHRVGIDRLVGGDLDAAVDAFRAAVAEDPCFVVGHAALAVAVSARDEHDREDAMASVVRAHRCTRRLTRAERHHIEVVLLALGGRVARASALAQEHLVEFPGDAVARHAVARWCGDQAAGVVRSGRSAAVVAPTPRS